MFFANGQNYNVILNISGENQLMHEPMPLIPRKDEWFSYQGQWYYVKDVGYYYPPRPTKSKMSVYLSCEPMDVSIAGVSPS